MVVYIFLKVREFNIEFKRGGCGCYFILQVG